MSIGNRLAAIALGMHDLERSSAKGGDLLDEEGFISIYCGGDRVAPRPYATWDEVQRDLSELSTAAASLPEGARGTLLRGMIKSLQVAARYYSGETVSFLELVRDLVGGVTGVIDKDEVRGFQERLHELLGRRGIKGTNFAERVEAWKSQGTLDRQGVETTYRELMAEAKARTDKMVFDTGDYDMRLNWFLDLPFGARCDFMNGKMDLNPAMRFTRAELKHLVCHEVYPGHSTQLLFTRAEVDAGRSQQDALLCAANALDGCIQEGIGDQGIRLIDWIEDLDDEISYELRRLRNAANTSATWHLMAEGRPKAEVASYLKETCASSDASIKAMFSYATHPFRGAFVSSYWTGMEAVGRAWDKIAKADRRRFIHFLCGQLQSPESVAMFQ
jgi:hypothetical protein